MKKNSAKARWSGSIKDGNGELNMPSIDKPMNYSFSSRFENESGTNPEELLAAAHAGCFSMALSKLLSEQGFSPEHIDSSVTISLDMSGEGPKITQSDIATEAKVPGITEALFMKLAVEARESCPVSVALSNLHKTMHAHLIQ